MASHNWSKDEDSLTLHLGAHTNWGSSFSASSTVGHRLQTISATSWQCDRKARVSCCASLVASIKFTHFCTQSATCIFSNSVLMEAKAPSLYFHVSSSWVPKNVVQAVDRLLGPNALNLCDFDIRYNICPTFWPVSFPFVVQPELRAPLSNFFEDCRLARDLLSDIK